MSKQLSVMWLGLRGFPNVQGGVEAHAEHLCPMLAELGYHVTVVARSAYQLAHPEACWRGVHFRSLWAPSSKSMEAIVHSTLGVLYAAVRRPDILHIHAIGPSLVTPLARILGLRVVVTHHGPDYEREKWGTVARTALRLGEWLGARHSNACIVISEIIQRHLRDKHEVDAAWIPNGVSLPALPTGTTTLEAFGLKPRSYILIVGRLVPEKRHFDLMKAFSQADIKDRKLVIVGAADHKDRYAKAVLEAAAGQKNVVCTGFQTGAALCELYFHAAVFVLPSSHEGMPIALLEAMSYGLPVIASDIPANQEVRCREIDYYPLGDVDALAVKLRHHALAEIRLDQRERLRDFVAKNYDWWKIAKNTHAVYRHVLENEKSRRIALPNQ